MADFRARHVLAAKLVNELVEAADDKQPTKTIACVAGNGTLATAFQKPRTLRRSRHYAVVRRLVSPATPPAASRALSEPR